MSGISEKEKASGYNSGTESDNGSSQGVAIYERPKGLKGLYYNPVTQIVMLGFVCFMCPGELVDNIFWTDC